MVELDEGRFVCYVSTKVVYSLAEAERLKDAGNDCFKKADYKEAADLYQQALSVAPASSAHRAVYFGNLAACYMHLSNIEAAVESCTKALEIRKDYVKVLLRRSAAFEQLKEWQKALDDARQVLLLDPCNAIADKAVWRLEQIVKTENEALKKEMIGKLKDFGNAVLGKFGVSLDDFKAEKDPDSGGYNLSFKK